MSLIVDRAKDIQARPTNHGICCYTFGQLLLEEYYVLGKAGLNTLHMDGNTRLCIATAAASLRESFGSDGQPGSYGDIDYTDCLFLVGHNMASADGVMARVLDRLAGSNPPQLVVVNPRTTETAKKATIHLAPKLGTNVALLNGLQHLIIENGWVNEEFVSRSVCGLDALKDVVRKYTPEYGVPVTQLHEAAQAIATSGSLLSTALQGVYQSNQATASACQINNTNLLLGHIGRPGSGILQMNGQPTAQNNRETGCDGEYPGFRNFQNPTHMQEIADIWKIDYMQVPHWNRPTHIENMLDYIAGGLIEMFWVSGTNPLVTLPHLYRVRELLTKPDLFLVVQDIFMTETAAAVADVVLPAAQWGEKAGCFTNADRTMHLSQKAAEPPGEAKSDLDIFLDFAHRMAFTNKHGDLIPFTTAQQVFSEWKKMTTGRPPDCRALSYEKLTGGSAFNGPARRSTATEKNDSSPTANRRPLTKSQYQAINPAGRASLKAAHYKPTLEQPDEDFPLALVTGRNVFKFHTRTRTGRSKRLQAADPDASVTLCREDADDAGVSSGEMVIVLSHRGEVELAIEIDRIKKGHVFIPFHFGYFDSKDQRARAANELTTEQWDPVSKQPMFKSGAVRIEKCVQHEPNQSPHERGKQTATIKSIEETKRNATKTKEDSKPRTRWLEMWLSATHESLEMLRDIYKDLIPRLIHDLEIQAGLEVMTRLTGHVIHKLSPVIERYHESRTYGRKACERLRRSVFPLQEGSGDVYEAPIALQSLQMFFVYIEGHLTALMPVSQALWDNQFVDAVGFAQIGIQRQMAWVTQHIKVKSPQTLLVPQSPPSELRTDTCGVERQFYY
ncbi:hypothetical protein BJX99DRAFT_256062 [Aspergillus californicus]